MGAKDELMQAFDEAGITTPDFWRKHIERYHPNGLKADSNCKYLNKPTGQREDLDTQYKRAEKVLQGKFGVTPVRFTRRRDLEDLCIDEKIIAAVVDNTVPTDDKDYKETIIGVAEVLEDIKSRYPNFDIGYPFVIPARMKKKVGMGGGLASVDNIVTYDSYLVVSKNDDIPFTGVCFGHNDERYFSDRVRHEIGHVLTKKIVLEKAIKFIIKEEERIGKQKFNEHMAHLVSEGSTRSPLDGIAEWFSFITFSDYKKGSLPKEVETIVFENMLGIKEEV